MSLFRVCNAVYACLLTTCYVAAQSEGEKPSSSLPYATFSAFTGKPTKSRVRLRATPSYEGGIVRELKRDELLTVVGESDDFYEVLPPEDVQGYIFRTYILDGVVEGAHVNVRLKPDLDAPILAQLNSGDRIEGIIDPEHPKWMKVKLPENSHLYVAKEYLNRVGDVHFKSKIEHRQRAAAHLLHVLHEKTHAEFQQPFDKMEINDIRTHYQRFIAEYGDMPEMIEQAKQALTSLEVHYLQRKLAYLEEQAQAATTAKETNQKLAATLQAQQAKISHLEQQVAQRRTPSSVPPSPPPAQSPSPHMQAWIPVEDQLLEVWAQVTGSHSLQDFYEEQKQSSFVLRGTLEPYTRAVRNKPGDFLLIDPKSRLPIAFVYSTRVNLQDLVNQTVALRVSPRDNHGFAFPAYFALEIE